jgi:hypothetical protein
MNPRIACSAFFLLRAFSGQQDNGGIFVRKGKMLEVAALEGSHQETSLPGFWRYFQSVGIINSFVEEEK